MSTAHAATLSPPDVHERRAGPAVIVLDGDGVIVALADDTALGLEGGPELLGTSFYSQVAVGSHADLSFARVEVVEGVEGDQDAGAEFTLELREGAASCRLTPLAVGDDRFVLVTLRPAAAADGRPETVAAAALTRLASIGVGTSGAQGALAVVGAAILAAVPAFAGLRFDQDHGRNGLHVGVGEPLEAHRARTGDGHVVTGLVRISLLTDPGTTVQMTAWSTGSVDLERELRNLLPYAYVAAARLRDANALTHAVQERDHLREAMLTRPVIEQAKGMIMMAAGCSAEDAFTHLVHLSSTGNRKLRDVAASIVTDALARSR